jgi:hypothetical protein
MLLGNRYFSTTYLLLKSYNVGSKCEYRWQCLWRQKIQSTIIGLMMMESNDCCMWSTCAIKKAALLHNSPHLPQLGTDDIYVKWLDIPINQSFLTLEVVIEGAFLVFVNAHLLFVPFSPTTPGWMVGNCFYKVSTSQCVSFRNSCLQPKWRSPLGTWKMKKKWRSFLGRFTQIWQ